MSYDVYLRCEHCHASAGNVPEPTYNLTPIFDAALTGETLPNPQVSEAAVVLFGKGTDRPRGLRVLSGRKAKDTREQIAEALKRLTDPTLEPHFRSLEPENKWGTLESAVECMRDYLRAATDYPEHVWEVH